MGTCGLIARSSDSLKEHEAQDEHYHQVGFPELQFARMKAADGDAAAYQYATIYAQWGNAPQSLNWLDTAVRVRDPGLVYLKADPLLDPLRNEPRFHAIERSLNFP